MPRNALRNLHFPVFSFFRATILRSNSLPPLPFSTSAPPFPPCCFPSLGDIIGPNSREFLLLPFPSACERVRRRDRFLLGGSFPPPQRCRLCRRRTFLFFPPLPLLRLASRSLCSAPRSPHSVDLVLFLFFVERGCLRRFFFRGLFLGVFFPGEETGHRFLLRRLREFPFSRGGRNTSFSFEPRPPPRVAETCSFCESEHRRSFPLIFSMPPNIGSFFPTSFFPSCVEISLLGLMFPPSSFSSLS